MESEARITYETNDVRQRLRLCLMQLRWVEATDARFTEVIYCRRIISWVITMKLKSLHTEYQASRSDLQTITVSNSRVDIFKAKAVRAAYTYASTLLQIHCEHNKMQWLTRYSAQSPKMASFEPELSYFYSTTPTSAYIPIAAAAPYLSWPSAPHYAISESGSQYSPHSTPPPSSWNSPVDLGSNSRSNSTASSASISSTTCDRKEVRLSASSGFDQLVELSRGLTCSVFTAPQTAKSKSSTAVPRASRSCSSEIARRVCSSTEREQRIAIRTQKKLNGIPFVLSSLPF
jgi:hypothetical protein